MHEVTKYNRHSLVSKTSLFWWRNLSRCLEVVGDRYLFTVTTFFLFRKVVESVSFTDSMTV